MTLKQAIREAVATENGSMLSKIMDQLRCMGFDYESTFKMFERCSGIDRDTFETLAYYADHADHADHAESCES